MTEKDAIQAAKVLKDWCYENFGADGCMDCNFKREDGKCELRDFFPRDWYLQEAHHD